MAEKIMIASGKGGVGKSTFAAFLGMKAAKDGKKVLLIDADTGLGALDILLGVSDRVMNTWLDVVTHQCDMNTALIGVADSLFLLPSPSYFPEELSEDCIKVLTDMYNEHYDLIIVDASAGIDRNLEICAKACDRAIFVATADEVSIRCAGAAAAETEKYGLDRDDMRLVVNRFVRKKAMKARLLNVDGVIDKSGVMLLGVLPEDKKIPFLSVTGKKPDEKSPFMKAVGRISDRINGKYIALKL